MEKKILLFGLIILVIFGALFFSPKQNNIWTDSFIATTISGQYTNMDCTCIGFIQNQVGLTKSDIQIKLCYGLPINCQFNCHKQVDGNWQTVPCD